MAGMNGKLSAEASAMFDPPSRSKQYVEYGVNQEGREDGSINVSMV